MISTLLAMCSLSLGLHPSPDSSLRMAADARRATIGSCVYIQLLQDNADDGRYAATLAREVNLVEPENELKPPYVWRGRGDYNFGSADFLLGEPGKKGWAAEHQIRVRGHVLVYARDDGYSIPRWLLQQESSISAEQAKVLLHEYIRDVAGRYRGKIAMWDVINEAIDDRPNDRPFRLRNSFWFRKLGPEFITLAFKYAHEADPKAELYYNDYAVENGGPKSEAMLALVAYARKNGAPVTGVGLQYHTILAEHVKPGDGHYHLLDSIKELKLAFMITELDLGIPVKPLPRTDPQHGLIPRIDADLEAQGERYGDIVRMALAYKNCHGIQMWGITDRHSWIPQFDPARGAALVFDADYRAKPAHSSVLKALEER